MIKQKIQDFINEIESRLKIMEDGKDYTVDRFEGDLAVCEDRQTKKVVNISKDKLPKDCKEGTILLCENGKLKIDKEKQKEVEDRIKEKMNNLWIN